MIYSLRNAPGAKVFDENGNQIRRVRQVDTDRSVIVVLDDPPQLNKVSGEVIEHEIAFERIEMPKLQLLAQQAEFHCYGRKA